MIKKLNKYFFYYNVPLGFLSWRSILDGKNSNVIKHHDYLKAYLGNGGKKKAKFLLFLFVGIKWVVFYATKQTIRSVLFYNKRIKSSKPLWRQMLVVLKLSMLNGVVPKYYFLYRLYDESSAYSWLNYVYDTEARGYHSFNSHSRMDREQHTSLLTNKYALETYLRKSGLPIAKTLHLSKKSDFLGDLKSIDLYVNQCTRVFCKPTEGNQAYGAFSLIKNADAFTIQGLGAFPKQGEDAEKLIKKQFSKHDYLIQPCYMNHSLLKQVQMDEQGVITIRIITQHHQETDTISLHCAYLEWPVLRNQQLYDLQFVPIVIDTGLLNINHRMVTEHWLDKCDAEAFEAWLQSIDLAKPLPHWEKAVENVKYAQRLLTGVYAIAWDLILTEDAAIILEGNDGWAVSVPQQINGPYLYEKNENQ